MSAAAQAADSGFALGVVAGANIENPSVTNAGSSSNVSGSTNWGGGLAAEMVLDGAFGLEVDGLYFSRNFSSTTAEFFGTSVSSSVSSGYLEFPVLVRFHPIPLLNLGAGLYWAHTIKAWSVSAGGYSSTTANYGNNDFGWALAVGTILPITPSLGITGDLRYTRSLSNAAQNSSDYLKFADVQILVGLRFGLQ